MGKVIMKVLTYRLRNQIEEYMADKQTCVRKDRSTIW